MGILACCISATVTINRFGFALEGAWCALSRLYYDPMKGQLKTSEPKWHEFHKTFNFLENISDFVRNVE